MSRSNPTPREVRATGARHAHGHILGKEGGALFVHLHREAGLAHRHYVLRPWQVRALRFLTSRPMLLVYVAIVVTWGWMASQAAQTPLLRQQVIALERDLQRIDSLSATIGELQARYDQVQRMLSAATAAQAQQRPADSSSTKAAPPR